MTQQTCEPTAGDRRSAGEICAWIVRQAAQALKVDADTINTSASLDSLGIDSMTAFTMTGELAGWLNRELPATLLWDYASIDAVAEGLAEVAENGTVPPAGVVPWQRGGANLPMFFFPGQGGHPVTFAALASHLGNAQPCYGLTVPGLEGEQSPAETVEDIARVMVANLRRVQNEGPYQLAGYSFGGLLAYEAAVQLMAAGERVAMLAIYDTFTRAGRAVRPWWQRAIVHGYMLLTQPGRMTYILDRVKRRAGAGPEDPPAVEELSAHAAAASAVERANIAALERYVPRPYTGNAVVFRATERSPYNRFYKNDSACGWRALVNGGVETIDLPGTHLSILDADHAQGAAKVLANFLTSKRA